MANTDLRRIERIVKGFANHRRIEILALLKREPDLSVEGITERLNTSYENISDHLRKLSIAGLVTKQNRGRAVTHRLTERGNKCLAFSRTI